jgi:hypothetical protein
MNPQLASFNKACVMGFYTDMHSILGIARSAGRADHFKEAEQVLPSPPSLPLSLPSPSPYLLPLPTFSLSLPSPSLPTFSLYPLLHFFFSIPFFKFVLCFCFPSRFQFPFTFPSPSQLFTLLLNANPTDFLDSNTRAEKYSLLKNYKELYAIFVKYREDATIFGRYEFY